MASMIGNTSYTLPEPVTLDLGGTNAAYVQNRDTTGKSVLVEFETQKSNKSVVLAAYGDAVRLDGVKSMQISSLTTYPVTIAYANQANDDGASVRLEPSDSFAQSLATVDTVKTVDTVNSVSDVTNQFLPLDITTSPLSASKTYTGAWFDVTGYAAVLVMAYSDEAGTCYLDWTNDTSDSTPWAQASFDIAASTVNSGTVYYNRGPYFRLTYANGSTAQSIMRLASYARRI